MSADVSAPLVFASLLIALVGFVDDQHNIRANWRLGVHLLGAGIVAFLLAEVQTIEFSSYSLDLGRVGIVFSLLWVAWFLNLFNFMDGIDGIAAVQTVTASVVLALLYLMSGNSELAITLATIGASGLGFLILNWPPAKIFMGDVGSSYLGFLFGSLALFSHVSGSLSIWVWLILFGVFVVDATVTLFVRMCRGEKLHVAHRNHAYQKASRYFAGHRCVTLSVLAINIVWLSPLACFATKYASEGWWITLLAWVPLLVLAVTLRAGFPDR